MSLYSTWAANLAAGLSLCVLCERPVPAGCVLPACASCAERVRSRR